MSVNLLETQNLYSAHPNRKRGEDQSCWLRCRKEWKVRTHKKVNKWCLEPRWLGTASCGPICHSAPCYNMTHILFFCSGKYISGGRMWGIYIRVCEHLWRAEARSHSRPQAGSACAVGRGAGVRAPHGEHRRHRQSRWRGGPLTSLLWSILP